MKVVNRSFERGICLVVWKELEIENTEFLEAYSLTREDMISEMEIRERILEMLSKSSRRNSRQQKLERTVLIPHSVIYY